MIHTIAFSESQDAGGVSVGMAAVLDPTMTVSGDDIQIGTGPNQIIGAIACAGASATRVYLISPSMRVLNPYEIQPLVLALVPTTIPQLNWHPNSPTPLVINEDLNCYITSNPASAEQASVVVWLVDQPPQAVTGKVFHARFTTTNVIAAGAWSNSTITMVDDLPSGVYELGGTYITGGTAIAARWWPKGAYWRPGVPVAQTVAGIYSNQFRNFAMGSWFQFEQTNLPSIEVLGSAATGSTAMTGVMDLIKVG